MKCGAKIGVPVLLVLVVAGLLWHRWEQDRPRRISLESLRTFARALDSNQPEALLDSLQLSESLQGRTVAEQAEFARKALQDEISDRGIQALERDGTFGPLQKIFPAEAETWSKQAGVKAEDCVAFKMERNGLRAEVVLFKDSALRIPNSALRIVRCNNVKQLAANF